jgi:tetratricopeptide (TPR) repeat protein
MPTRIASLLFVAALLLSPAAKGSPEKPRPLRQSELLALIAGNALPENVINEIRARGVAFHVDDSFRTQLTTAGATPLVLSALDAAKSSNATSDDRPDPALLQHITAAAKLMKDKRYQEAADELTATLKGNFEKFESGFVMGHLLVEQENWGQAAAVYAEVLRQDSDFPEAHTKLSFVLYKSGAAEEALREAKAALLRSPQNAEAHKNAGLALQLLGKQDAAVAEYKEAIRIKPDYGVVHYDMALLFDGKRDLDAAIAEYKKAIALDANFTDAHDNLGLVFREKGDFGSAIRESREAKRLDPNSYNPRHNLAAELMDAKMYPEAIREFRELEAMFPDAEVCHLCLGRALYYTWDFKGAEKELRMAATLDPGDPEPVISLGAIFEEQKDYDAALAEYEKAEELDENSYKAHRSIGSILLTKKKVRDALKQLKLAVDLDPSLPYSHDLYGQALMLSGDVDAALGEFKESLALEGKQPNVRLELAAALEKKGDWVTALDQYRQAAVDDRVDRVSLQPSAGVRVYGAAQKYSEAKERFTQHLAALRKAGKSTEAAQLEKSLSDTQSAATTTQKLDWLMQSGSQAFAERRFDDSERDYKKALQIAESLQPHDSRLTTILAHLGQLAAFRKDFTTAEAIFERQLKVTEELYGSQAIAMADPLKWLAMNAMAQRDFPSAKKFLDRALEVNRKVYGENSAGYMDVLRILGSAYLYQESYDKAEPYLVQATEIERKLYDYQPTYGGLALMSLSTLCTLYERWNQPGKLEPCDRQLIVAIDKQSTGPDTHFLELTLAREAKTLRTLGRPQEAAQIEQRLKSLQPSAANNPN